MAAERRFWLSRGDLNTTRQILLLGLGCAILLCPMSAWAWGLDGHKIVAVIAADNLTPAAASHVASILGAPPGKRGLVTAMEAASILPDTEFRDEDHATAAWHFIDICLQDRRADIAARCPGGNCVTAKIDEYSKRLKDGNHDRWRAFGDLAFLIHFVGDIHQPLHAASDSDRGGNCIPVDSTIRATNLHEAWDTPIVRRLEYSVDSGRPETTAHKLEKTYGSEQAADSWIPADDIAWESNQVARADIYAALHIPVEPCQPAPLRASIRGTPRRTGCCLPRPGRRRRRSSTRQSGIQAGKPAQRDLDPACLSGRYAACIRFRSRSNRRIERRCRRNRWQPAK